MGLYDGRELLEQGSDPRFAPGANITPTGASWDKPFRDFWLSLPESVRQSYASAPEGLAAAYRAFSTPGAIQDTVEGLQDTARSARAGEGWGTATNLAKALGAAVGVIPGGKLVKTGLEKVTQEGLSAAQRALVADTIPRASGEARISTRFPTGVGAPESGITHHLNIGPQEILASPKAEEITQRVSTYPGFARLAGMNPEERVREFTQQTLANKRFIYENMPDVIKREAPSWYESAGDFNRRIAKEFGIPEASMHGATAALSPQKDWYMNASLAERMAGIIHEKSGVPMTPEMRRLMGDLKVYREADPNDLRAITGVRFNDLEDPLHQAMWLRLRDEAHNPRGYRTMSPTGELGDFVRNTTGKNRGEPSSIAWGNFNEIGKAIQAMQSGGDTDLLSTIISPAHKVRNFFNNMAVPMERRFGDVTADTHEVAGNLLMPLSGNTAPAAHNFASGLRREFQPEGFKGAPSSVTTGVMGTYGLNVAPTRALADELGILPRAAQSVGWEGTRALFPDTFKTPDNVARIEAIWRAVDRGEISADRARQSVLEATGGFKIPDWAQPRGLLSGPQPTSTYR